MFSIISYHTEQQLQMIHTKHAKHQIILRRNTNTKVEKRKDIETKLSKEWSED